LNRINELTQKWKSEGLLLPIWSENNKLYVIDQRALPRETVVEEITDVRELAKAIKDMSIRGSGAIGISGVYGMMLAAMNSSGYRSWKSAEGYKANGIEFNEDCGQNDRLCFILS